MKLGHTPLLSLFSLSSSNKGLKFSRFRDSIAFLRALARPVKPSSAEFEAFSLPVVFEVDLGCC
jgi:hypothetical protein